MKQACRFCFSNNLTEMINLGRQPIAHRLLSSPQEKEKTYPFIVYYCRDCGLIQICEPIDPKLLYLDYNYCFSSWKLEPHIEDEIETILSCSCGKSVFEIGCNDGKFLQALKRKGVAILLGAEPNPFAREEAKDKGFSVYPEMFSLELCEKVIKEYGRMDLIVARQVLEHTLNITEFFRCIDLLLSENGLLFIDIPDFETALSMGDCSMLWEEHVSYFTQPVISNTLIKFGFQPLCVKKHNFSGTTLAVLAKRTPGVINQRIEDGLFEKVRSFKQKVNRYGRLLRKTLAEYRRKGYRLVLYGTGCRACTVVNGLSLAKYIDFAIDDRPERQNKYMPGSRLQIMSPQAIGSYSEPVLCLLAVNQESEANVRQNLKNICNGKIESVSLFLPNNIWEELKKLK